MSPVFWWPHVLNTQYQGRQESWGGFGDPFLSNETRFLYNQLLPLLWAWECAWKQRLCVISTRCARGGMERGGNEALERMLEKVTTEENRKKGGSHQAKLDVTDEKISLFSEFRGFGEVSTPKPPNFLFKNLWILWM